MAAKTVSKSIKKLTKYNYCLKMMRKTIPSTPSMELTQLKDKFMMKQHFL